MMARIGLERDDVEAAEKALDEALAKDFEVRKNPYYFFIQSFVLESKDRVEDAKDALKKALQVPRFESVRNAKKKKKKKKKSGKISKVVDGANLMVKIYERLAKLHHTLKQIGDAESTIREALEIFEGTAQETELRIVESRQAMERGDAHKALKLLALLIQSSDVSEETWIQATQVKADIYLKHRKHKKGFIKCYQRISQRLRNKRGYVLLGDAYMRIHDPTKAIESYERALREQPGDVALTVLIGNTMMTTHNYQAAVEYFESALDSHGQDKTALRLALAELLTRLKRWSEAQAILSDAIRDKKRRNNNNTEETTASWIEDVHILRILTNVYFGNGDDTQALETIQKANSIQDKILSRLGQNSNAAIAQKKIAAEIRCVIGTYICL
jgi:tetratricopeptide repeat protein 21B